VEDEAGLMIVMATSTKDCILEQMKCDGLRLEMPGGGRPSVLSSLHDAQRKKGEKYEAIRQNP
jgi:hypothetical protein